MPSLTFVLPHWLYWSGLIIFPLLATYLLRRSHTKTETESTRLSLPIAYFLLFTGGFVGLHRFYLRAPLLAFVYIALFLGILYGNRISAEARIDVSNFRNDIFDTEYDIKTAQTAIADEVEGAQERLAGLQTNIESLKINFAESTENWANRQRYTGYVGMAVLILLLIDGLLLPRMARRVQADELEHAPAAKPEAFHIPDAPRHDPAISVHSRFTDAIDSLSGFSGQFVSYWSLIAVFVYYYEVVARYVFNSPTNWVHEGMFLMFGMQYLLSGAYALREDSHVRVDVLYEFLPDRVKVIVDICSSVFFFIFVLTLLGTGWIFAMDAVEVWEVSFTEWAIQYWPVKATIAVGALLILLQGISKLIKDVILLTAKEA